jgi:hypothetical protein
MSLTEAPFREASMPKPSLKQFRPEKAGIDWLAIEKTLVLQILVLLAIGGAVIEYLNWSSRVAQAEFASALELMTANPASPSRPSDQHPGAQSPQRLERK